MPVGWTVAVCPVLLDGIPSTGALAPPAEAMAAGAKVSQPANRASRAVAFLTSIRIFVSTPTG